MEWNRLGSLGVVLKTHNATGTMPALSSTNTGIVFLWHFPVNEVDHISVPMYDNALCRLLIFPLQASETLIWMDRKAGDITKGVNGAVWKAVNSIEPQLR